MALSNHDLPGRSAFSMHHRTERVRRQRRVVLPTLRTAAIVILDNLGTHKGIAVRRTIRQAGVHLLFLPPTVPT
jgi:transposase